jgi:hypothetical protein
MRTHCKIKDYNKNKAVTYLFSLLITVSFGGCKKFITIDGPDTSVNQKNVYTSNSNAISAITGIYTKMANSQWSLNLSLFPDLSADNLVLYDMNNVGAKLLYRNTLSPKQENITTMFWVDSYSYIYDTNAAIEGLTQSDKLSDAVKTHLLGEAYFLRAYFYFYLVNLYGEVPLVLSTDYTISSTLSSSPTTTIYNQIISDLKASQQLIPDEYVNSTVVQTTEERTRPNKSTVTALLSRVFLYTGNYAQAKIEAAKIINQSDKYSLNELNAAFKKNSKETIWALQPVSNNVNTMEGSFYIYPADGPNSSNYVYLSTNLLNSFEPGDGRKSEWISTYTSGTTNYAYPAKYKVKDGDPANPQEYTIVFRLSEQYLIRAESEIELGNTDAGVNDLNQIRKRSRSLPTIDIPNSLPDLPNGLGKDDARKAVQQERRVELFSEWGNRWFDLKRTNTINEVMTLIAPSKSSIWASYQSIYPIPLVEILANPNLKQNDGYN